MMNKPWPSDAVMVISGFRSEVDPSILRGEPWPTECRDCHALLTTDSYSVEEAYHLPSRQGRPVLYFCVPCATTHDPGTITELYDHREGAMSETSQLLAEHALLMNRFGADSVEVAEFVNKHRSNADFVELAEVAHDLKVALMARPR